MPNGNTVGTYGFILVTPQSTQQFEIALDSVIGAGSPAAGAGAIEAPGAVDVYTFEVDPGTDVFFNEIVTSTCAFTWTLSDASANVLFSQPFGQCGPDPGTLLLDGGPYTLMVHDPSGNSTGTYSFILNTEASVQHFELELDELVSDGVPSPGAGRIEYAGAVDQYTFSATPGATIFFNEVVASTCAFTWTLLGADESIIFEQQFGQCGPDPGTLVLDGGEYTLRVRQPDGNLIGTYSFNLVTPESAQHFDLLFGQPVANGTPAPGAGNLEEPGAVDLYSFVAEPGAQVFFNELATTSCVGTWTLSDELGATLFSEPFDPGCGPDAGVLILDGGSYTLRVEDLTGNNTAVYSLSVCSVYSPDIDCNGAVNGADLGLLLAEWGSAGPFGDLDKNDDVDGADLGLLLAAWTI